MGENSHVVVALLVIVALLALLTQGPLLLALYVHPCVGALVALSALPLWAKLVRPAPGYFQGIVSLAGLAAILGALLTCLALFVTGGTAE
jgi:hypothetical protein